MTYAVSVSQNLGKNSHHLGSYQFSLVATDEPERPLEQRGPVRNDILSKDGVFETLLEACKAAADFIGLNVVIVEIKDFDLGTSYVLAPYAAKYPRRVGESVRVLYSRSVRVLYSRTAKGEFVAS